LRYRLSSFSSNSFAMIAGSQLFPSLASCAATDIPLDLLFLSFCDFGNSFLLKGFWLECLVVGFRFSTLNLGYLRSLRKSAQENTLEDAFSI